MDFEAPKRAEPCLPPHCSLLNRGRRRGGSQAGEAPLKPKTPSAALWGGHAAVRSRGQALLPPGLRGQRQGRAGGAGQRLGGGCRAQRRRAGCGSRARPAGRQHGGRGAGHLCEWGGPGTGMGTGRGSGSRPGRGKREQSRGVGVAACKTGLGELQMRRPGLLLCCEGCFCKFLRSVIAGYILLQLFLL